MFKTSKLEKLLLNNNQLKNLDNRVYEMLPNLKIISLQHNDLHDIPEFFAKSKVSKFLLANNPFRCDCDPKRFLLQNWITSHIKHVQDIGEIYCMENVTKAFLENDTTALSGLAPNDGEDVFKISIIQFLKDANR